MINGNSNYVIKLVMETQYYRKKKYIEFYLSILWVYVMSKWDLATAVC